MRITPVVACTWLVLLPSRAGPGHAQKRVALGIGSGTHRNVAALADPVTDARDVRGRSHR